MDDSRQVQACVIENVGKSRNGWPRFWCKTHGSTATGRYGAKLANCEAASHQITQGDSLDLDPHAFPGGIAIWGAVAPVYDTSGRPAERGIHVHARRESDGEKEIDATYSVVSMAHRRDLLDEQRLLITQDAAVQYYIGRYLKRKITTAVCTFCGQAHLDVDYFAVHPHQRHLCHGCGRYFMDSDRSISNPIVLMRQQLGDADASRTIVRPARRLDVRQSDYPGGIQVWASNPAIVWTAGRPEEEGIHVHLYQRRGAEPCVDETFGSVRIDDIDLDEVLVRQLMAQQALPYLENKVVSLSCPKCGHAHFDKEDSGFDPYKEHICESCGTRFLTPGKRKLAVSNPLIAVFDHLRTSAPPHDTYASES